MIFLNYGPLYLRGVEPADADLLYDVENDVEAWPDSDIHAPYSREMLRSYAESYRADPLSDGQLRMIAVDAASSRTVGILDLYDISALHGHACVGIYVLPDCRRHGFGRAMIEAAVDYARRRLGLHTLAAKILADNTQSIRLFTAAGFRVAGTLPAWHFADGRYHDVMLLAL